MALFKEMFAERKRKKDKAYHDCENTKIIADCEKIIAVKPDDAVAYSNMGTAYYALGKYADAVAAYKKYIAIDPDFAYVYYKMGEAYRMLRQYPEALAAYKKLIDLKPTGEWADDARKLIRVLSTKKQPADK